MAALTESARLKSNGCSYLAKKLESDAEMLAQWLRPMRQGWLCEVRQREWPARHEDAEIAGAAQD